MCELRVTTTSREWCEDAQVLVIQVIAVTPDPDSRCARARDPATRERETRGAEADFEEEAALAELDSLPMPAAHVHG